MGTAAPWSFGFNLNGANLRTATNISPTVIWDNLTPIQIYTLAEVAPDATWQVGAISCSVNGVPTADADPNTAGFQVNVTPGANVVCSITNTKLSPQFGTITVTKVVTQTQKQDWTFIFTLDDTDARSVTKVSPSASWTNLAPNRAYVLAENDPGIGWVESSFTCTVNGEAVGEQLPSLAIKLTIKPGDNVVCTKLNTDLGGATNLDPVKELQTFQSLLFIPTVKK